MDAALRKHHAALLETSYESQTAFMHESAVTVSLPRKKFAKGHKIRYTKRKRDLYRQQREERPMNRESVRRVALSTILMIVAAQLSLNLFSSEFIISIAIVLPPFFLMIWGKYPVLPAVFLAGAGNFVLRTTVNWLSTGEIDGSGLWQEMIFYAAYGLLFYCCCRRAEWSITRWQQLVQLVGIDYLSNLAELICRGNGLLSPQMHLGLLAVAVLRTVLVLGFWLVLRSQSLSLLRQEHAERYRHLVLLISRLRGEVIWMQKTSAMMEETMNTAYKLYTRLQAQGVPDCVQALSISKDIHEIKKEYQLVIRGLSEALAEDMDEGTTDFQSLWQILFDAEQANARHAGVQVEWEIEIETDFQTNKQFQLLSVLRNLIDNAIEAAVNGRIRIAFSARHQDDQEVFTVTNWGKPIPAESLPCIFDPGFSTKVDYTTGRVGRGIGLCLVRDLTEQELHGTIRVEACNDRTSFRVSIPTTSLEVPPCDSI